MKCPVCDTSARYFVRNRETNRVFFRCYKCDYVFTTEKQLDFEAEEKYFKEKWENKPDGGSPESYPILQTLLGTMGKPPGKALDFGCGNGGLIRILRNSGIHALGVDPIPVENDMGSYVYSKLDDLPETKFDVITAIEVFEHLDRPCDTLSELLTFLDENGFIFITTALINRALTNIRYFPYWVYQRDLTHIGFFHERTFEWLAAKFKLDIHILDHYYVVLDKSFKRLIIVYDNHFVFAKDDHSYVIHRPELS